jgi:hypothetical protein
MQWHIHTETDVMTISCMKKRCCDKETNRWPIFSFGLKFSSHL